MKRSLWLVPVFVCAAAAADLSLVAQAPTNTSTQSPAPAEGQRGADQGRGRGGGGGGATKDAPVNAGVDWTKQPSVLPNTPADELKHFILQPGYRLELVLADPDIQDPTAIMFDGNGRMFVLENPGYMADKDANGELDPVG